MRRPRSNEFLTFLGAECGGNAKVMDLGRGSGEHRQTGEHSENRDRIRGQRKAT
jgi:hypothetical protein